MVTISWCLHGAPCKPVSAARVCNPKRPPKTKARLRTLVVLSSSSPDAVSLGNKLNIPLEALAAVAGGVDGSPSRFSEDILSQLADLPMTDGVVEYRIRAEALQQWKTALQKGILPDPGRVEFPTEPFKTKFMDALSKLEMPRFTRRHPKLADALLRQMLVLTRDFEIEFLELQAQQEEKKKQKAQSKPQKGSGSAAEEPPDVEGMAEGSESSNAEQDGKDQDGDGDGEKGESSGPSQGEGGKEMQISLEQMDGGGDASANGAESEDADAEALAAAAAELADKMAEKFEKEMAPVVESLEAAMGHLGDLDELLDGQKGWDLSSSVWKKSGWREFKDLRKKLENLRELRDLVRSLGRGGGKGPLRRAPEEVYASRKPAGVIRSQLVPEEVQGLMRSGNLSLMLPSEAALLAAGWPREHSEDDEDETEVEQRGYHPARLLFMARMAEKGILSYERAGWVDDEPSRVTGRREIRPAAELGPIIVCLDTSGSMTGAREIVAKSIVLECMRGAHNQGRRCFVYAFSGPGQVQSLELDLSLTALEKLLDFLQCSFSGGTDVDAPFELALARLRSEEWSQADILMVTDGEIRPPASFLVQEIERMREEIGLEVHGLLVGSRVTPAMEDLCSHIHMFKSWSVVGGSALGY